MIRPAVKWLLSAALCITALTTSAATLVPGQILNAGQSVKSDDGRYSLLMQYDGNLVLYRLKDNFALWNTGTVGRSGAYAYMQGDGNFVIYQGSTPVWHTYTGGRPGAYLYVQNDGNVVIYAQSSTSTFYWHTATGQRRTRQVTLEDANLTLCVRALPDQYVDQVETIECPSRTVRSVRGIEQLPVVSRVNFRQNSVADIAPLSRLSQLREVDVSRNVVTDLAPLRGLKKLERVNASENKVTDVTPLREPPVLRSVDISRNDVRDVRPLSANRSVVDLTLSVPEGAESNPLFNEQYVAALNTSSDGVMPRDITLFSPTGLNRLRSTTVDSLQTLNSLRVNSAEVPAGKFPCSTLESLFRLSELRRARVFFNNDIFPISRTSRPPCDAAL